MSWVQNHIVELGALLGSLYAVARVFVALTPTPRDDVALAKVNLLLRMLAKVFGLDLKQGVEKIPKKSTYPPTPKTNPLRNMRSDILLLCLLLVTGCSTIKQISPEVDLLIAQKTFAAVVRGLTDMQIAGKFEPNETKQLTVLIHEGEKQLVLWEVQLRQGQPTPSVIVGMFDSLVHKLVEFQLKGGV